MSIYDLALISIYSIPDLDGLVELADNDAYDSCDFQNLVRVWAEASYSSKPIVDDGKNYKKLVELKNLTAGLHYIASSLYCKDGLKVSDYSSGIFVSLSSHDQETIYIYICICYIHKL